MTFRKIYLVFTEVPSALENAQPHPPEAPVPSLQSHTSQAARNNIWGHHLSAWISALALIQDWQDDQTLYKYGGAVRHYSKLMLFMFYHINLVLKHHRVCIYLYQVLDHTPWRKYGREHYTDSMMTDTAQHSRLSMELKEREEWMMRQYSDEAQKEFNKCITGKGNLDRLSNQRAYEDRKWVHPLHQLAEGSTKMPDPCMCRMG